MSMTVKVIWIALGIFIIAAVAGILLWDIPAPSTEVRKTYTFDQLNQRSTQPHNP